MRDFSLVVSTYNRAQLLAALLSYLEMEKADCHILVLDSSSPEVLSTNRARVGRSSLDIEFAEFPHLEPGERCHRGIHKITTPFCALCADGDLVILEGLRRCLDALRGNLAASVVVGRSFTFLPRPDGDMELNGMQFGATINDASPLERVGKLFQQYQEPSYGVFRTPALQRICDALGPMTRTFSRELLWSALSVVEGQLIRLPNFSYGRCIGPSDTYGDPLRWFCKNADDLFAEYFRYRELVSAALLRRPDNDLGPEEIRGLLDLIHLRYLARHAPDSVLEFIAEQEIAGVDFAEYWPRREIHLPLREAVVGARESSGALAPMSIRGRERSYVLSPNFYAPAKMESPQLNSVAHLIGILDGYRP